MKLTQKEFDSRIKQLMRRAELLREARDGSVKLRQIDVKKCTVVEHVRAAHSRFIAPKSWKSRTS